MDLERLRSVCRDLPGTTEDVKWGADLCFCVGDKMYAVFGLEAGGLSFKAEPLAFEGLISREGVVPAPYLARHAWVYVEPPHRLPDEEIAELLRTAHALVAAKLPRRIRDGLRPPGRD